MFLFIISQWQYSIFILNFAFSHCLFAVVVRLQIDRISCCLQKSSKSFKPHNLLLTAAFGASKKTIDEAYDVPELIKYLDFIHVMAYNYAGSWTGRIIPNAALRSKDTKNIEFTIDHLIGLGAPPSKLVLGLAFYGKTYVTNSDGQFGDVTKNTCFQGPYTKQNGCRSTWSCLRLSHIVTSDTWNHLF